MMTLMQHSKSLKITLKYQNPYPVLDWVQIFCRLSLADAKHLQWGSEQAQVTRK